MSTAEQTTAFRDEIMRFAPGAVNLAGFRKQAADLDWQADADSLRNRLKLAHKRLGREGKRIQDTFDVESLKITSAQKIVRALGTSMGWDRSFDTPAAAVAAHPQTTADENSPLTRQERFVRQVIAETKDDQVELRLLKHATPYKLYRWLDTMLPIQLLDILSLVHIGEQLDRAAMVANALFCSALEPEDWFWDFIGLSNAYLFKIGQEGWQRFAEDLGLDAETLLARNHHGLMLDAYGEKICGIAPTADEFKALVAKAGKPVERVPTAEDVAKGWRDDFMPILEEPKRT
jgi:hypothetical protein